MLNKRTILCSLCALMVAQGAAVAQSDVAPTPKKLPRVPVSRETLYERGKTVLSPSQTLTGTPTVIDAERLKINDVEVRLFGVVPPNLSASFGPQARAVVDALVATGPATCTIRDRDREGHYLATCKSASGHDYSLELLRRGLAVSARGTLRPTELAAPYIAAEQAAQTGKLGLWSMMVPPAASESAMREAAARAAAEAAAAKAKEDAAKAEAAKTEAQSATDAKAEAKESPKPDDKASVPVVALSGKSDSVADQPSKNDKAADVAPKVDPLFPYVVPMAEAPSPARPVAEMGLLERYQLLVTGILMVLTVIGIVAVVMVQRWLDKREEKRSVAAALRGELMAARAVCLARLGAVMSGDSNIAWPRIRSIVFQAYVGRIGMLGSLLARQISSIYGQASDYASYYHTTSQNADQFKGPQVSKKHALQTLVNHIEEVLPRLATMEQGPRKDFRLMIASAASRVASLPSPVVALPSFARAPEKPLPQPALSAPEAPKGAVSTSAEAKPAPLWSAIRKFATERMERASTPSAPPAMEDHFPDYTALSEDEAMEAMVYGGDLDDIEMMITQKDGKSGKAR